MYTCSKRVYSLSRISIGIPVRIDRSILVSCNNRSGGYGRRGDFIIYN